MFFLHSLLCTFIFYYFLLFSQQNRFVEVISFVMTDLEILLIGLLLLVSQKVWTIITGCLARPFKHPFMCLDYLDCDLKCLVFWLWIRLWQPIGLTFHLCLYMCGCVTVHMYICVYLYIIGMYMYIYMYVLFQLMYANLLVHMFNPTN